MLLNYPLFHRHSSARHNIRPFICIDIDILTIVSYVHSRRARAERESRRKAIQERTKKGILPTEEEKAFLAASSDKDDCLIM